MKKPIVCLFVFCPALLYASFANTPVNRNKPGIIRTVRQQKPKQPSVAATSLKRSKPVPVRQAICANASKPNRVIY